MRAANLLRRSVARRPVLGATVCATLALAVGATTAMFSIVDAIVLKPLPYPAPDRLVAVYESNAAARQATALVAPGRLEEWNDGNRTFDGLAGSYFENMTDTSGREPERVEAMRVSPRFFTVLGVPALIGRTFTAEEERFGGPAAVVLAERFWRGHYSADPAIVGRQLTLGGIGRLVVGVMPAWFAYPSETTDAWIPAQAPPRLLNAREARFYTAIGRLKSGIRVEAAQADLAAVQAQLAVAFPSTDAGWTATIVPLKDEKIGRVRGMLWLLLGAVLLLLFAACANVACVMLADAASRERELAVRHAVGASRGRIVAMLGSEGACLAAIGAAAGLILASWTLDAARAYLAALPRASTIHLDVRVVAFAASVTALATFLFAVAPAAHVSGRIAAGRGAGATITGRGRVQQMLVVVQVALAVVLLSGAGLLVRSVAKLEAVSPGFQTAGVLTFRVSAQWNERPDAVSNRQLRTLERLRAIAGVRAAALGVTLPASLALPPGEFRIRGRDTGDHLLASSRGVSARYFDVLQIPILQGATCTDDPAAPFEQVVVTRAFAQRFFSGESAVGHWIERTSPAGLQQRIVGVAGDVREDGVSREAPPLIYTCGLQPYWPDPYYLVRTDGRTTPAMIRAALTAIEPDRAMYSVRPLDDVVRGTLMQPRVNAVLLSAFALSALLLAALGLYGVLAQMVAAARREIGIRVALGAPTLHVISTVVSPAAAMTAIGLLAGVAMSLALARAMEALVGGVPAHDPVALVVAPSLLAVAAAAATLVPAHRASQLDPAQALRQG